MRVISGKYKGTKLKIFGDSKIRPTSDRLKEAIFSTILSEKYSKSISQKKFLDLCSGSGSIGIEAFSRGAGFVCMIDIDYDAMKLIKKNIQNLNLSENDNKKILILQDDATKLKKIDLPNFDFVYIDPPYKNNTYNKILSNLIKIKIITNQTLILVETGKIIDELHNSFSPLSTKKYGNSFINIIKMK